MRAKLQAFGVGFAATLALGIGLAWAQQSTIGGGSARPTVAHLQVRGAPVASVGHIGIRGASTGVSAAAWVSFADAAGTRIGYVGDGSTGSNDMIVYTDQAGASLRLYSGAGGNVLANESPVAVMSSGSFTCTFNGFTTPPTHTCYYWITGHAGFLRVNGGIGTSNATTFTISGIPAAARPALNAGACTSVRALNSGVVGGATLCWQAGGDTLTLGNGDSLSGGWTASGTKGLNNSLVLSYPVG